MRVKIVMNERGNPPGKLADAELHFDSSDGVLSGLKLIGFGIWERRGAAGGQSVTFPGRSYTVNYQRRSFALLRPIVDVNAQEPIRALILEAYAAVADASPAAPHTKVLHGRCDVCGHYGSDCTGTWAAAPAPSTSAVGDDFI